MAAINDEELRSHFESAGTVKRVRIVRDSATFMGKGFGFVEFEVQPPPIRCFFPVTN
jgi:RNA recognition motif-containing protein